MVLCLILVALGVLAADTAYLTIDLTSQKRNHIQIFWTGEDGVYSQKKSITEVSRKGRNQYVFPITDALFVKNVRVDLQQGRKGRLPRPVSLHSMKCEFKWLFASWEFSPNLEDLQNKKGIEKESTEDDPHRIVFTDPDPHFEFQMELKPKYYQLILPLFFILGLHYLLVTYLLKERKNRYLIDLEIQDSDYNFQNNLSAKLQQMNISSRMVQASVDGSKSKIRIEAVTHSAALLRSAVSEVFGTESITRLQIVAARSGECK